MNPQINPQIAQTTLYGNIYRNSLPQSLNQPRTQTLTQPLNQPLNQQTSALNANPNRIQNNQPANSETPARLSSQSSQYSTLSNLLGALISRIVGSSVFDILRPMVPETSAPNGFDINPLLADASVSGTLERDRVAAFSFSAAYESNGPATIQNVDSGIVSYGKHQATLKSGALEAVIREYLSNAVGDTAAALSELLPRIVIKDPSLRTDFDFLNLLQRAADEPTMVTAQDVVFTKSYWFPALTLAEAMNLHSQVARTIFFDTAVQGGLRRILSQTNSQVPRNLVGERAYLETFLNNRVDYLNTLADKFELSGNTVQAQMLRNSAAGRVGKLQQLLAASDLR